MKKIVLSTFLVVVLTIISIVPAFAATNRIGSTSYYYSSSSGFGSTDSYSSVSSSTLSQYLSNVRSAYPSYTYSIDSIYGGSGIGVYSSSGGKLGYLSTSGGSVYRAASDSSGGGSSSTTNNYYFDDRALYSTDGDTGIEYSVAAWVRHVFNRLGTINTNISNILNNIYYTWYGFDSHVNWCACFVSWCADQCGYLDTSVPRFCLVEDGISWYQSRGLWQSVGYEPVPGDIIFFDWEVDHSPDHVGIVADCTDGIITTVEGNMGDAPGVVSTRTLSVDSPVIYGYGTPDYPAGGASIYSVLTDISRKLDHIGDFEPVVVGSDEPITGSVYSTYYVPGGDPEPTPGLNNLCTNGNFNDVSYFVPRGCSYTVNDHVAEFTSSISGANSYLYFSAPMQMQLSHRYYVYYNFYSSFPSGRTQLGFPVSLPFLSFSPGSWSELSYVFTPNISTSGIYDVTFWLKTYSDTCAVGDKFYFKNLWVIDLTEMYGAGNEPTIEQFRNEYPDISYNASSLIPVTEEINIDNSTYFPLDVDSQEYVIGDFSAHSDTMSFTVTADTVPDLRVVACLPNGNQIVCNNIIENVNALDEDAGASVTYQVSLPASIPWVDSWNIRLDGAHLTSIGCFNFLNLGASARAELQLLSNISGGGVGAGYDDTAILNRLDTIIANQQNDIGLTSCDHQYVAEVSQEPSCVLPGLMVYTCDLCGASYSEIMQSLGHDWLCTDHVEPVEGSDGEITQSGYDIYTCQICNRTYYDYDGSGAPENESGHTITDLISQLFGKIGSFFGGLLSSVINMLDKLLTGFDHIITSFNEKTQQIVNFGGDYPAWLGGIWTILPADLQLAFGFCVLCLALGIIGKKTVFA